jgi:hypothetical protein
MHDDELTSIQKRDALGRVTINKAQREALLDEFERSGMKGVPFARLVGVNYQTFASWIQKRRHARGGYALVAQVAAENSDPAGKPKPPLRLMEAVMAQSVVTPQAPDASSSQVGLELVLPGGVILVINGASQIALAAQLLNALRTPC